MSPREFCSEHSGQRALLKALLGLTGVAVTLLLFQVGLTLSMSSSIKDDLAGLRERVAVIEYQLKTLQK